MCQQMKALWDPSGKRGFFTNNFHTHHISAEALKKMTDNEARLPGTVKFTNADAANRFLLQQAISHLKDSTCGPMTKHPICSSSRHDTVQPFIPPLANDAHCSGCIVWKDTKAVIFHTNDLCEDDDFAILPGCNARAVKIVGGLTDLQTWNGSQCMHLKTSKVPSPIVACNNHIDSVDQMDQMHSTNPKIREEQQLHMSVFNHCADLATHKMPFVGTNAQNIKMQERRHP